MKTKYLLVGMVVLILVVAGVWLWLAPNRPPVVSLEVEQAEGQAPFLVTFDGTASFDPDGQIEEYIWHIDDEEIGRGPELAYLFDTPGEYAVTLTVVDNHGATASTTHQIVVYRLPVPPKDWASVIDSQLAIPPLLADIQPADGAVIRSAEAWIRWGPVRDEALGRVLWRKADEPEVRVAEATTEAMLRAHIQPLETGATYEYVVEQFTGDFVQRSELRSFTVAGGIAFSPTVVEAAIERDHDQQVTLTLRNTTGQTVTVAAQAVTQIEDLPADIVGPGSVDDPVELPPGEELELLLSIYAADATQHTYEIVVEAAGAVGRAALSVGMPTMALSFQVIGEDPHTLAQRIEVRNVGDILTDLSLRIVSPYDRDVRLQPSVGNARLEPGGAMEVVATPVLFLEFERLSAEIEATAAGQSQRHTVTFEAPPGVRLMAARSHSSETSSGRTSYCAPEKCTNVSGSGGTGPAGSGSNNPSGAFSSGPGEVSGGMCEAQPCSRETLRSYYQAALRIKEMHRDLSERLNRAEDEIREYTRELNKRRLARERHPVGPQTQEWPPDWVLEERLKSADNARWDLRKEREELESRYEDFRQQALAECGVTLPPIMFEGPGWDNTEWWESLSDEGKERLPEDFPSRGATEQNRKRYHHSRADQYRQEAFWYEICTAVACPVHRPVGGRFAIRPRPPHPITLATCIACKRYEVSATIRQRFHDHFAKNPPRVDFYATEPPYQDFQEVTHPILPALLPIEGETHLERLARQAANAQRWQLAYMQAWEPAYQRYRGAEAAGDVEAMILQAEAMVRYSELMVDAASTFAEKSSEFYKLALPELVAVVQDIEANIGFEAVIEQYRQSIGSLGLLDEQLEMLRTFEVPESEIEELGQRMLELTPDQLESSFEGLKAWVEQMEVLREIEDDASRVLGIQRHVLDDALYLQTLSNGLLQRAELQRIQAEQPIKEISVPLRIGLLQALQRRASFSREHRGPLAASFTGETGSSEAFAASFHAGDRILFAWHQNNDQVVFAAFNPLGEGVMEPQVLGNGRWPQVTADDNRTAVGWETDAGFLVRVHDGTAWSDEIPLHGREAALDFADGGALYAATTSGLWQLADSGFEQVRDVEYTQPALAMDSAGQPHVAWLSQGQIVYEGEVVTTGEQPSIIFTPDGTLHLAYVSGGALFVRHRENAQWSVAEEIPAENPRWPALALGDGDEVRVSYIGDADIGPPALWLVRLPDTEPILMPSLAGNVTDAWLIFTLGLNRARSHYRPMDILVTVNDVWALDFHQSVPEGRYIVRLDPNHVFTSSGSSVWNRIGAYRWYGNTGANLMWADYKLTVRRGWSEYYGFASTPEEVVTAHEATHRINHDQADLALFANALDLPLETPTGPVDLPVTIVNLGEAASQSAQLVMEGEPVMNGSRVRLQAAQIPVLQPDEQVIINMRLDGHLERVTFRIEYEEASYRDFDPSNDQLTVRLWNQQDYERVIHLRSEPPPVEPEVLIVTYPNDVQPPWVAGGLPRGATAIGKWTWHYDQTYQAVPSHSAGTVEGRSLHYFIRADEILPLASGDNLIQYVYLDPESPPQQILLQAYVEGRHEGSAVYWGGDEDLIQVGGQVAQRVGDLPEPGQWVRLKIPIAAFGIKNAWINGLLFGSYDGEVRWGPTAKSIGRLDDTPPIMIISEPAIDVRPAD
jgi:PKD repeat protein